ncbi:MAG: hypothetical protein GX856_10710 [Gammaproteobacteria bacterium]|jgi:hypothetical protein|nr:hypothetical protein [Gammaproteobacteria bacterium]
MKILHRSIAALMVAGGLAGAIACAWALVDPSIMAPFAQGPLDPPSPRWRAAFGLLASIAALLFGSGRLRHRELP